MAKRRLQVADLKKMVTVSDVQIGEGGKTSVGVVKRIKSPTKALTRLFQFSGSGSPKALTSPEFNARNPRFEPGSGSVAFVSQRGDEPEQIYILPESGGEAIAITAFPEGDFADFKFSRDGKWIAALHRATAATRTKEAKAKRERNQESEPPYETSVWPYRLDGDGYPDGAAYKLWIINCRTGKQAPVALDTDSDDISFDWMPDSESLAISYRKGYQRYLEPDDHALAIYKIADKKLRSIGDLPQGDYRSLKVSPTGKYLVFNLSKVEEQKWGMRNEYLAVYDFKAKSLVEFVEGQILDTHPLGDARDACGLEFFWSFSDEKEIYFPWALKGQQHIWKLNRESGELLDLTPEFVGEIHVGSFDAASATFGTWITTPTAPTEVAHFGPTGFKLCSKLNPWLSQIDLASLSSFDLECVEWPDSQLQCWRLTPPQFDSKKKHPAVVSVHGGPQCMYATSFFFELQLLAGQGFVVYFCNPRGSTGYGQKYAACIEGDWGNLDWKDIQTLTKFVQDESFVDKKRVGIIGGSYGGFMVNWAISHSHDYARAVTDRCVSNLLSKWGNSDYLNIPDGWWPGGAFYDYKVLWECSPIKHFATVVTPTLVVHSEGDLRCNIEQGEQVYAALKVLGVETKFIRYPRTTSHGMSRGGPTDLRIHRLIAYVDWLKKM